MDSVQRAEEEAAKLYEDFVESFGEKEEDAAASKSFVRGGTIQPSSSAAAVSAAAAAGEIALSPDCSFAPWAGQTCLQLTSSAGLKPGDVDARPKAQLKTSQGSLLEMQSRL